MYRVLPSDVARLFLAYLQENKYEATMRSFIAECPHLQELRGTDGCPVLLPLAKDIETILEEHAVLTETVKKHQQVNPVQMWKKLDGMISQLKFECMRQNDSPSLRGKSSQNTRSKQVLNQLMADQQRKKRREELRKKKREGLPDQEPVALTPDPSPANPPGYSSDDPPVLSPPHSTPSESTLDIPSTSTSAESVQSRLQGTSLTPSSTPRRKRVTPKKKSGSTDASWPSPTEMRLNPEELAEFPEILEILMSDKDLTERLAGNITKALPVTESSESLPDNEPDQPVVPPEVDQRTVEEAIDMTSADPAFDSLFSLFNVDREKFLEDERRRSLKKGSGNRGERSHCPYMGPGVVMRSLFSPEMVGDDAASRTEKDKCAARSGTIDVPELSNDGVDNGTEDNMDCDMPIMEVEDEGSGVESDLPQVSLEVEEPVEVAMSDQDSQDGIRDVMPSGREPAPSESAEKKKKGKRRDWSKASKGTRRSRRLTSKTMPNSTATASGDEDANSPLHQLSPAPETQSPMQELQPQVPETHMSEPGCPVPELQSSEPVSQTPLPASQPPVAETQSLLPEAQTRVPGLQPSLQTSIPFVQTSLPESQTSLSESYNPIPHSQAVVPGSQVQSQIRLPESQVSSVELHGVVPELQPPITKSQTPTAGSQTDAIESQAPGPELEISVPESQSLEPGSQPAVAVSNSPIPLSQKSCQGYEYSRQLLAIAKCAKEKALPAEYSERLIASLSSTEGRSPVGLNVSVTTASPEPTRAKSVSSLCTPSSSRAQCLTTRTTTSTTPSILQTRQHPRISTTNSKTSKGKVTVISPSGRTVGKAQSRDKRAAKSRVLFTSSGEGITTQSATMTAVTPANALTVSIPYQNGRPVILPASSVAGLHSVSRMTYVPIVPKGATSSSNPPTSVSRNNFGVKSMMAPTAAYSPVVIQNSVPQIASSLSNSSQVVVLQAVDGLLSLGAAPHATVPQQNWTQPRAAHRNQRSPIILGHQPRQNPATGVNQYDSAIPVVSLQSQGGPTMVTWSSNSGPLSVAQQVQCGATTSCQSHSGPLSTTLQTVNNDSHMSNTTHQNLLPGLDNSRDAHSAPLLVNNAMSTDAQSTAGMAERTVPTMDSVAKIAESSQHNPLNLDQEAVATLMDDDLEKSLQDVSVQDIEFIIKAITKTPQKERPTMVQNSPLAHAIAKKYNLFPATDGEPAGGTEEACPSNASQSQSELLKNSKCVRKVSFENVTDNGQSSDKFPEGTGESSGHESRASGRKAGKCNKGGKGKTASKKKKTKYLIDSEKQKKLEKRMRTCVKPSQRESGKTDSGKSGKSLGKSSDTQSAEPHGSTPDTQCQGQAAESRNTREIVDDCRGLPNPEGGSNEAQTDSGQKNRTRDQHSNERHSGQSGVEVVRTELEDAIAGLEHSVQTMEQEPNSVQNGDAGEICDTEASQEQTKENPPGDEGAEKVEQDEHAMEHGFQGEDLLIQTSNKNNPTDACNEVVGVQEGEGRGEGNQARTVYEDAQKDNLDGTDKDTSGKDSNEDHTACSETKNGANGNFDDTTQREDTSQEVARMDLKSPSAKASKPSTAFTPTQKLMQQRSSLGDDSNVHSVISPPLKEVRQSPRLKLKRMQREAKMNLHAENGARQGSKSKRVLEKSHATSEENMSSLLSSEGIQNAADHNSGNNVLGLKNLQRHGNETKEKGSGHGSTDNEERERSNIMAEECNPAEVMEVQKELDSGRSGQVLESHQGLQSSREDRKKEQEMELSAEKSSQHGSGSDKELMSEKCNRSSAEGTHTNVGSEDDVQRLEEQQSSESNHENRTWEQEMGSSSENISGQSPMSRKELKRCTVDLEKCNPTTVMEICTHVSDSESSAQVLENPEAPESSREKRAKHLNGNSLAEGSAGNSELGRSEVMGNSSEANKVQKTVHSISERNAQTLETLPSSQPSQNGKEEQASAGKVATEGATSLRDQEGWQGMSEDGHSPAARRLQKIDAGPKNAAHSLEEVPGRQSSDGNRTNEQEGGNEVEINLPKGDQQNGNELRGYQAPTEAKKDLMGTSRQNGSEGNDRTHLLEEPTVTKNPEIGTGMETDEIFVIDSSDSDDVTLQMDSESRLDHCEESDEPTDLCSRTSCLKFERKTPWGFNHFESLTKFSTPNTNIVKSGERPIKSHKSKEKVCWYMHQGNVLIPLHRAAKIARKKMLLAASLQSQGGDGSEGNSLHSTPEKFFLCVSQKGKIGCSTSEEQTLDKRPLNDDRRAIGEEAANDKGPSTGKGHIYSLSGFSGNRVRHSMHEEGYLEEDTRKGRQALTGKVPSKCNGSSKDSRHSKDQSSRTLMEGNLQNVELSKQPRKSTDAVRLCSIAQTDNDSMHSSSEQSLGHLREESRKHSTRDQEPCQAKIGENGNSTGQSHMRRNNSPEEPTPKVQAIHPADRGQRCKNSPSNQEPCKVGSNDLSSAQSHDRTAGNTEVGRYQTNSTEKGGSEREVRGCLSSMDSQGSMSTTTISNSDRLGEINGCEIRDSCRQDQKEIPASSDIGHRPAGDLPNGNDTREISKGTETADHNHDSERPATEGGRIVAAGNAQKSHQPDSAVRTSQEDQASLSGRKTKRKKRQRSDDAEGASHQVKRKKHKTSSIDLDAIDLDAFLSKLHGTDSKRKTR